MLILYVDHTRRRWEVIRGDRPLRSILPLSTVSSPLLRRGSNKPVQTFPRVQQHRPLYIVLPPFLYDTGPPKKSEQYSKRIKTSVSQNPQVSGLSKSSKNAKVVKNCQNCQKVSKLLKIVEGVRNCNFLVGEIHFLLLVNSFFLRKI